MLFLQIGIFYGEHISQGEKTGITNNLNSHKNKKEKAELGELVYEMATIVYHHFPDLHQQLRAVSEVRKAPKYRMEEIVGGAIAMFMFKTGSRHRMDNIAGTGAFRKNFRRLFHLRLPTMDTVANVFEKLDEKELEELKINLVKSLIEKRVLDKQRYKGKFLVSVDGTGLVSFQHKHCDKCCVKTYKPTKKRLHEKKVYFHRILEAKLVTESGFSISLCSEWIENEGKEYAKQDCELTAFGRLADKLKSYFPRSQIIICADGLYPNNTFFQKCQSRKWDYIITLPDKALRGLWRKINHVEAQSSNAYYQEGGVSHHLDYEFINNIEHNGYLHNWLKTHEIQSRKAGKTLRHRFVHLTNIPLTRENVPAISRKGRLRWRIEKEGFDQQKNEGYNITHKYCRNSYTGMKNFYQACQIAHLLNQLLEMSKNFRKYQKDKITKKHLWFCLLSKLLQDRVSLKYLARKMAQTRQIEYIQEKVYLR